MRLPVTLLAQLWRERAWTDEAIAAAVGTTANNVTVIRHRYFRFPPLVPGRDEHGRVTWELQEVATRSQPVPVDTGREVFVRQGLLALVASQAEEITRLRALTHELEERILAERLERHASMLLEAP